LVFSVSIISSVALVTWSSGAAPAGGKAGRDQFPQTAGAGTTRPSGSLNWSLGGINVPKTFVNLKGTFQGGDCLLRPDSFVATLLESEPTLSCLSATNISLARIGRNRKKPRAWRG
jgi:hypothetical protein